MKSPRTTTVLALLIFFAALGGYGALWSLVHNASAAIGETNRQAASKNAQAARLVSVRDRLAELGDIEGRVHAYFVPDTGVVTFINELQARGSAVGAAVEISSVAASSADKAGHSTLKIALSITGPFDAVMRTLGSLEYAPYDLSLTNLSLIADPSKNGWTANATFAVASVKGSSAQGMPAAVPPTTPVASTTPTAPLATSTPVKHQP